MSGAIEEMELEQTLHHEISDLKEELAEGAKHFEMLKNEAADFACELSESRARVIELENEVQALEDKIEELERVVQKHEADDVENAKRKALADDVHSLITDLDRGLENPFPLTPIREHLRALNYGVESRYD